VVEGGFVHTIRCKVYSFINKQIQDCELYVGYFHKTCGPHDCYMRLAKVWDEEGWDLHFHLLVLFHGLKMNW
jgi:hypothetical protein